jgi:hypothetical protein
MLSGRTVLGESDHSPERPRSAATLGACSSICEPGVWHPPPVQAPAPSRDPLNSAARASAPHPATGPCPADPTVVPSSPGAGGTPAPARIPRFQALVSYNARFGENPQWGLLTTAPGPGYAHGLLAASSTRQPGLVTLTDVTPSVLGWLGRPVPAAVTSSPIQAGPRTSLAGTLRLLRQQDAAAQVYRQTVATPGQASHGGDHGCPHGQPGRPGE